MPNLRPVPLSENPHSSWQNLIQKTVQSNTPIAGSGLRAQVMGDFTRISVPNDIDFERLVWRGDFDEFAEYFPNDVVRVSPNVDYVDVTTGESLIIGSTSDTGHPYAPLSLGLFVCVQHVPASWANEEYFYGSVVASFPDTIPYTYQNGIRWDSYNYYYPMYPEIPTNFTSSVDIGYGFPVIANQTFWQAMPFGTMPMRACQNGVAKTFYIVGAESGSMFLPEYLPYSTG